MKNKNPLINMKYVKGITTDGEILKGLRNLNEDIFKENEEEKTKIEISYRKKTHKKLINHIVVRVQPQIWKRMLEKVCPLRVSKNQIPKPVPIYTVLQQIEVRTWKKVLQGRKAGKV